MSTSIHEHVGAYSLGLLTPSECDAFEAHLAECDRCGEELDRLMQIAEVMPDVAEPAMTEPVLAEPISTTERAESIERAEKPRTGLGQRRIYALAACLVLLAVGAVGGVIGQRSASHGSSSSTVGVADPLQTGQLLTAVDTGTGVRARLALTPKGWGTNIALELSNVHGPVTCRLVAVGKDGTTDTAMTWAVPDPGYGTQEQPKPLVISGGTSIDRPKLDRFEIRTNDGKTLVSIPA